MTSPTVGSSLKHGNYHGKQLAIGLHLGYKLNETVYKVWHMLAVCPSPIG